MKYVADFFFVKTSTLVIEKTLPYSTILLILYLGRKSMVFNIQRKDLNPSQIKRSNKIMGAALTLIFELFSLISFGSGTTGSVQGTFEQLQILKEVATSDD